MIAAAAALSLGTIGCATASGGWQTRVNGPTPEVVLFSQTPCPPCEVIKQQIGREITVVDINQRPPHPLLAEFAKELPTRMGAKPEHVGPYGYRFAQIYTPTVWVRGDDHCWVGCGGMDDVVSLRAWINERVDARAIVQHVPTVTHQNVEGTATAGGGFKLWPFGGKSSEPPVQFEPLDIDHGRINADGVIVIAHVSSLTEGYDEIRSRLAVRAEAAFHAAVTRALGENSEAHVVAEVADPVGFEQLAEATGVRPGDHEDSPKLVVHVLVPKILDGMKGRMVDLLRGQLRDVLHERFQNGRISIVSERLDPVGYRAAIEAVSRVNSDDDEPPSLGDVPTSSIVAIGGAGGLLAMLATVGAKFLAGLRVVSKNKLAQAAGRYAAGQVVDRVLNGDDEPPDGPVMTPAPPRKPPSGSGAAASPDVAATDPNAEKAAA